MLGSVVENDREKRTVNLQAASALIVYESQLPELVDGCGAFFASLACGIGDAAWRERVFASAIAGFRIELVQGGHALFLGQF